MTTLLQNIEKMNNFDQHLILWKKKQGQNSKDEPKIIKKTKKENWKNFACSLKNSAPINIVWDKIACVKSSEPKKVNILEVKEVQYKNNTATIRKISDTPVTWSIEHPSQSI